MESGSITYPFGLSTRGEKRGRKRKGEGWVVKTQMFLGSAPKTKGATVFPRVLVFIRLSTMVALYRLPICPDSLPTKKKENYTCLPCALKCLVPRVQQGSPPLAVPLTLLSVHVGLAHNAANTARDAIILQIGHPYAIIKRH